MHLRQSIEDDLTLWERISSSGAAWPSSQPRPVVVRVPRSPRWTWTSRCWAQTRDACIPPSYSSPHSAPLQVFCCSSPVRSGNKQNKINLKPSWHLKLTYLAFYHIKDRNYKQLWSLKSTIYRLITSLNNIYLALLKMFYLRVKFIKLVPLCGFVLVQSNKITNIHIFIYNKCITNTRKWESKTGNRARKQE